MHRFDAKGELKLGSAGLLLAAAFHRCFFSSFLMAATSLRGSYGSISTDEDFRNELIKLARGQDRHTMRVDVSF